MRRSGVFAVVLLSVLSLAAACPVRSPSRSDGCGDGGDDGPVSAPAAAPATPRQPAPVPETLWTLDRTGRLRAFDARTNTTAEAGRVGPAAGQVAGAAADGTLWLHPVRDGEVTTVVADGVPAEVRTGPVRFAFPWRDALWLVGGGRLRSVDRSATVTEEATLDLDATTVHTPASGHLLLSDGRRVATFDPATRRVEVVALSGVPERVTAMTAVAGTLVVNGTNSSTLHAVELASGNRTASVELPDGELVFETFTAHGDVWVVGNCGHVFRLAGTDLRILDTIRISGVSQTFPAAMAGGSLWVCDEVRSDLVRIDLETRRIAARIPVPAEDPDDPAFSVITGGRAVWVLTGPAAATLRVDPETNRLFLVGTPDADSAATSVAAA